MAVLPIRTFPDPILKSPSQPVDQITPKIQRLVAQLVETMRRHPRCVGLAAPQLGVQLAVAVVDVTGHPKVAQSSGLLVCINPLLIGQEGERIGREGCLSVPDLTGNVQRAVRVHLKAWDLSGRTWTRWCEGFEAAAVQHELDHLAGRLFLDRVMSLKTDVFRRKTYL